MSNRTKDTYAHGAIVRIKLENFVTYDSLEFSPGPNLNVIIGPNGTGKSTIVCAICLGMTGKPVVLGRAGSICDFIKNGKNKATIEIELNNSDGRNFIVRRIIYKDNKTEWFLNDKSSKLKDIEDLVDALNIQVSNLCQFLPQEKVSEFARMNSQELLENTEKAVGGLELFKKHEELKENSKHSKDLEREVNMVEENLKKEEAINSRLKDQVTLHEERQKHEESIKWLHRKKACMVYKQKRDEYERMKAENSKMTKEYDDLVKLIEPMNKKRAEIEGKMKKQKDVINSKTSVIQECLKKGKNSTKKLEEFTEQISEIKNDYQAKQDEHKNHKNKLKELEQAVEVLRNSYNEAKTDLKEIQKNESEIDTKIDEFRRDNEKFGQKEYEYRQEMAKLRSEIETINKQIMDVKNVKEEKMKKLRERFKDTFMAVTWLNENRSKFTGAVYEPIFLTTNVLVQKYAKYVENAIPNRDLTSMFLFERSDDMNFFITEVRNKLQYIINAALIPDPREYNLENYKPNLPIEELKKYGFQTYLREIIEAPEPILVYLCLYANIHNIPIGNESTQSNISSVMKIMSDNNIMRFYTSTLLYSITKSRYTGKTTTSSSEIPPSIWLATSVNQNQLSELETRQKGLAPKEKDLKERFADNEREKKKFEAEMEKLRARKNELRDQRYYIENLGKKLATKISFLKQFESQNLDLISEAKERLKVIATISKSRAKVFADYIDIAKNLVLLNKDKVLAIYQDAQYQNEKIKIESDMRTYLSRKQELEPTMEQYQNQLRAAKDEAKSSLENASRINNVNLEKGSVPDEYKAKFADLPDKLEKLETEIHQLEAISQCSGDVDAGVVQDYKNREKTIAKLRNEFETKSNKLHDHQSNYESLRNEWLEKVEQMISDLNVKFSMLFQQVKCSGEVSLGRPDNSEEFSKYGITIKVSFRSDEKLQELTAWQQSGGEKSVSTMLYMIALQEMTKCPFRVVDEINQGMDPVNERKVFDIIVQNSCSKQFAQYFLLTPKLLPDLSFDEKTNVICVFNGPYNLPHFKYNLKKFLQIKRELNKENM